MECARCRGKTVRNVFLLSTKVHEPGSYGKNPFKFLARRADMTHRIIRENLKMILPGCLAILAMIGMPAHAANPCAMKNPCAAKNPCAMKSAAEAVTRLAGYQPYRGKGEDLVAEGGRLFKDSSLSTNGMSCSTCHADYASYQETFAKPFPHYVRMPGEQYGLKAVHADEMVQICMTGPMMAGPLPWDSKELAALAAFVTEEQKGFAEARKTGAANPCAMKNPCAPKNPCAVKNPCAPGNPCAVKNPCAPKNPCSGK